VALLAALDHQLKCLILPGFIQHLLRVVADAVHLDYEVSGLHYQLGVVIVPSLDKATAPHREDLQSGFVLQAHFQAELLPSRLADDHGEILGILSCWQPCWRWDLWRCWQPC
jgi:hypothetical protein